MKTILPLIKDRNHFQELFAQNEVWEPAISYLSQKHGLKGKLQRGVRGSHIVYRTGDVWIKLMAPLFAQDMAFEISGLQAVTDRVSVATPKILGQGELEDWSYVILSHVQGEPIRDLWPRFSKTQKENLTEQIARTTIEISRCPADKKIESRFDWNHFIRNQFDCCEDQQRKKKLPEDWLQEVKKFLSGFNITEFQTPQPKFLHADLTFDHFLITCDPEPRVSGILDLADCQVGHFEYELCAPSVFIFKSDSHLLRRYLLGCGFSKRDLNPRFSEKLLAWSLLHRYYSFTSYFQGEMNACKAGDFSALARRVFPL